jgi:hypothetical protein
MLTGYYESGAMRCARHRPTDAWRKPTSRRSNGRIESHHPHGVSWRRLRAQWTSLVLGRNNRRPYLRYISSRAPTTTAGALNGLPSFSPCSKQQALRTSPPPIPTLRFYQLLLPALPASPRTVRSPPAVHTAHARQRFGGDVHRRAPRHVTRPGPSSRHQRRR